MLAIKAREIATEASVANFSASDIWISGFKARHKYSMRAATRQSQISPDDINTVAEAFATLVEATVRELGIKRIYNADQTGCVRVTIQFLCFSIHVLTSVLCVHACVSIIMAAVFFEYLPKRTLNATGEKTVWVKCGGASKDRATVMLLGDSDGVRYTSFIIFKMAPAKQPAAIQDNQQQRCGFGKRVWAEMRALRNETSMEIYANAKGMRRHVYLYRLCVVLIDWVICFVCKFVLCRVVEFVPVRGVSKEPLRQSLAIGGACPTPLGRL